MGQVSLRDATITINDGGVESVSVKIGEGNLTFSEKKNMEYLRDRGLLDRVRQGDDEPMDLSFDFVWDYIEGSVTVEEALKRTGNASSWVTSGANCDPYAVDVVVALAHSENSCEDSDTYTFSEFRYETLDHDLRASTVSCSGRCNSTTPDIG